MIARLSHLKLLLIALGMLIASILIAIYPSYTFVRGFVEGAMFPLEQFDSNETLEFRDETPYSGYILSLDVDHPDEPLPSVHVIVNSPDGEVRTEEMSMWAKVFGREYRRFLIIDAPPSGRFDITVECESSEDFLIYRNVDDVLSREIKRSTPLWIAACVPLILMVITMAILITRLMRDSDQPSLSLKDEL